MRLLIPLFALAVLLPTALVAQNDSVTASISEKSVQFINEKYGKVNKAIDKQTAKMLDCMQRQEAKLQKKLQGIDSTKAAELFANSQATYQSLMQKLQTPINPNITNPLKEYR